MCIPNNRENTRSNGTGNSYLKITLIPMLLKALQNVCICILTTIYLSACIGLILKTCKDV